MDPAFHAGEEAMTKSPRNPLLPSIRLSSIQTLSSPLRYVVPLTPAGEFHPPVPGDLFPRNGGRFEARIQLLSGRTGRWLVFPRESLIIYFLIYSRANLRTFSQNAQPYFPASAFGILRGGFSEVELSPGNIFDVNIVNNPCANPVNSRKKNQFFFSRF